MRALLLMTALVPALAVAGGAMAQTSIRPGQTVQGSFSAKDPKMEDDTHYRCYVVQTTGNQVFTVRMDSDDFDAFLAAGPGTDCDNTTLSNDDGADMGTSAELRFRSDGGPWVIKANTVSEGEVGRYTLRLSQGQTLRPTTEIGAIQLGQTIEGEIQFSDRQADDGSFYDCYRFEVTRAQQIAIQMNADDLDAYLQVHRGGTCEGASIASDDDSGGGTNARISQNFDMGVYSVRANSLNAGVEGEYSLSMTSVEGSRRNR